MMQASVGRGIAASFVFFVEELGCMRMPGYGVGVLRLLTTFQ